MVENTHEAISYPPQMRHGGSPPAHLSSSSLSDPSWWLQFKWSQPPPRAPEWLFDYYRSYNPPANVGRPPPYEEWLQQAIREDREAAGLLPPEQPYYGPLLHEARARADRAYRDWKAAIDDLWADEYGTLLVAARARQREAARQEAASTAHRLLHEQADRARQEAATRRQRSLDKETACPRRAVQARQTAAARVIFLWLRRRRLFARLARQTSRRLQHEAALARMQHEQECCASALQAVEHRRQAAAVRAKAIADEANQRKAAALR